MAECPVCAAEIRPCNMRRHMAADLREVVAMNAAISPPPFARAEATLRAALSTKEVDRG